MAKIPHLHWRPLKSGMVAWNWKPSPRLRALAWENQRLGEGPGPARKGQKPRPPADIVAAATQLNEKLEQWEAGCADTGEGAAAPPQPKRWTFQDLVDVYRASPAFALKTAERPDGLAKSTRKNYNSCLRQLIFWAQDGRLALAAIDKAMVTELRDALLEGSRYKAAAMLRVLRVLLHWGRANGALAGDPTEGVKIPTAPSRTRKTDWETVQRVIELARGDNHMNVSLALAVAFWSFQRKADLLGLNRMAWRTFEAIDPRDRPVLANAKGEVKGFRLQQSKTGKWVDCPMPPFLHDQIEAAFASSQWLFPHADDSARAIHERQFGRRVRHWLDIAGLSDLQFRDFRRSGMSWAEDMGALRSDIVTISGHQVLGRATILDTYMPPDTRGACTAIATILRTQAAIAEREKAE